MKADVKWSRHRQRRPGAKSRRRGSVFDEGSGRCESLLQEKESRDISIIKNRCTELQKMQNDEEWECFYETQAASLEGATLSGLEAIRNVFAVAQKRNPEIAEFNPSALRELHYRREIDDADISTGWTVSTGGR
jgi:hypothetical protein